jgi:hypothetical protein
MTRPLRVLHLEDSPRDAELIRQKFDVEGVAFSSSIPMIGRPRRRQLSGRSPASLIVW